PGGPPALRQLLHALVFHFGASVPAGMEGEDQPILIVDETRVDFFLYGVGLAAELGAHVGNLDRLTLFILSLEGDLAGLGLPDPGPRGFEPGEIYVEGVADRIDLPKRIETEGLRDFFRGWRTALCPGGGNKK